MIAMLKRIRVGVGARIYLAIAAIVLLTIVASMVASLSFGRVTQTVRSLFDEHYPVVELSRELAQVASATVAMAPKLAEVVTDSDRTAVVGRLEQGTARMRSIVDRAGRAQGRRSCPHDDDDRPARREHSTDGQRGPPAHRDRRPEGRGCGAHEQGARGVQSGAVEYSRRNAVRPDDRPAKRGRNHRRGAAQGDAEETRGPGTGPLRHQPDAARRAQPGLWPFA